MATLVSSGYTEVQRNEDSSHDTQEALDIDFDRNALYNISKASSLTTYDAYDTGNNEADRLSPPQPPDVQLEPKEPHHAEAPRPRMLLPPSARRLNFLIEFINLIFTALFLAFGIAVIKLKGQPQSPWTDTVDEATRLVPTLFPILFSSVLGNSLKNFAHFKLERGATILSLEQLIGSQTVASAVKNIYVLRSFGLYSFVLITLWAFNPLGSQASLRSVYLENQFSHGTSQISFQSNNFTDDISMSGLSDGTMWELWKSLPQILHGAALFEPVSGAQYSNGSSTNFDNLVSSLGGTEVAASQMTTDIWNNVRIPDILSLAGYNNTTPGEWVKVPVDTEVVNYTSLIGLPARQGNSTLSEGNTTFIVNASYHHFKCSPWENITNITTWLENNYHTLPNLYNASLDKPPYNEALQSLLPQSPLSDMRGGFFMDTVGNISVPLEYNTNGTLDINNTSLPTPIITFVSAGHSVFYNTRCNVNTRYVDANITCLQGDVASNGNAACAASYIREADPPAGVFDNFTAFNFQPSAYNIAKFYPSFLPSTSGSTPTEMFIADPPTAIIGLTREEVVELGSVPIELFEKRFGLLFNTFWKASINPRSIVGGSATGAIFVNTTAFWTQKLPSVYALDVPWLIVFFLANLIMFVAAVSAVVLKMRCETPHLLGYVSTLTRDSEYIPWARGIGSSLDGDERARLLGEEKVRIADVKGTEEVGRIALVAEGAGVGLKWTEVVPGRFYD